MENKEFYINNINFFERNFEKKVAELEEQKNENVQELIDAYVKSYANHKVGDFLRAPKINFFIKVERIEGKYYSYDGGSISIYYRGYAYKKLNGQLIRTKSQKFDTLCDDAILIKVDENNNILN